MNVHHKHYYKAISIIFIVLVISAIAFFFDDIFVEHKINKTAAVLFIVFVYVVGSAWVLFHHKSKFNHNHNGKGLK